MAAESVIIIGAGIGGLATANLLAKAGHKVTVYEKNGAPGGRAGWKEIAGFSFDTGPSWYLMPEVFERHFALFGRSARQRLDLVKLSPAYKVFFQSRAPITITGDEAKDRATFEAIEPGAGEALGRYVEQGDETYSLALRHFLYTNFERPQELLRSDILRRAPRFLRLLTTPIHTHVAGFVRSRPLQQILEYPMVFLGSSPFTAPAMYSLMSALDFREGVFYPSRGIHSIIDELMDIGRSLGVTYRFDAPVARIETDGRRAVAVHLENGERIVADIIISNADLHFTETKLLEPAARSYPASFWKKKEAGISALLLYLGVKGKLPQMEHHNLMFVDDWEENFRDIYDRRRIPRAGSLYVCKPSQTDPQVAPKGHENLFVLLPLPAGVSLSAAKKEALTERILTEISTYVGEPDLSKRIVYREAFGPGDFEATYNAWQGSALGLSHLLTQSAFWRPSNKSKKLSNLYYVGGNTVPGVGLPMCLISAELVYKRVMGIKTGGPLERIGKELR